MDLKIVLVVAQTVGIHGVLIADHQSRWGGQTQVPELHDK